MTCKEKKNYCFLSNFLRNKYFASLTLFSRCVLTVGLLTLNFHNKNGRVAMSRSCFGSNDIRDVDYNESTYYFSDWVSLNIIVVNITNVTLMSSSFPMCIHCPVAFVSNNIFNVWCKKCWNNQNNCVYVERNI